MKKISVLGAAGCTAAATTWTDVTNSDKTIYIGDATSNAFIYSLPTLSGTICTIGSSSVEIVSNNISA